MNKTPIEWTDFSVNPFRFRNLETGKVGHHCAKISPGCKNCYSSKMQSGFYLSGLTFIEENKPKGEFFLDENALQQVLRRKKSARIFWCDMTDMFLEDYPDEWIDRCFAVMALTPHLTHQVLTKRAKRMREYFDSFRTLAGVRRALNTCIWASGIVAIERAVGLEIERIPEGLPNVWLGVSVEDQQRADERIPELLQTPAAVRFLSVEPLLGSVDLRRFLDGHEEPGTPFSGARTAGGCAKWTPPVDWVIVGGESGPVARPMHPDFVRGLRDQCVAAGVPFFFKQWGEWAPKANFSGIAEWGKASAYAFVTRDGPHSIQEGPDTPDPEWGLRCCDLDGNDFGAALARIGKRKSGRLLDGREWNEIPEVRA